MLSESISHIRASITSSKVKWLSVGLIAAIFTSSAYIYINPLERSRAYTPSAINNLLPKGNFESGNLTGWEVNGAASIVTNQVHSGTYAVRSTGGNIRDTGLSVTAGKTYKVTGWIYLVNVSGGSWGGPRIEVFQTPSWASIGGTTWLQDILPFNTWYKVAFSVKPTESQLRVSIGAQGDRIQDLYFDDIQVFEEPISNQSPTVSINSNLTSVNSIPGSVNFTSTVDDTDGAISYFFWDFGDGGKSNLPSPSHSYLSNGTYKARLIVYDDSGAPAVSERTITVNDPTYPHLTIESPSVTEYISNTASLNISGTSIPGSGSSISKVEWSTDRGIRNTATGTNNWNFSLDLTSYGGKNRILVTAFDSNGRVSSKELVIDYRPAGTVSVQNGSSGVTRNNSTIERYEKFETTFNLQNGIYSNPYIPYETNVPEGMRSVKGNGVTVEGIFTSPTGKVYTQPGFYYQPYTRSTSNQTLIATGNPVWKIRYAPQELGNYTYQIKVTDASGTSTLNDPAVLNFNVVAQTNPENHGFIRVSEEDPRYFEFSDGTTFTGVGPGPQIGGLDSFATDTNINAVAVGSGNLSRTWMSGSNIGGSSWAPWTGAIEYDGNIPGSGLTAEQAYGNGQYSLKLPHHPSSGNRMCAFYGFQGVKPSVKSNTNYRIAVRLKAVGITGTGGFTFRPNTGWPDNCNQYAANPKPISYVTGNKDWHLVTGTWNSGSAKYLGHSLITLENVTSGAVYIDEISIREDLGNGSFGPEVLPRSKFNTHEYFSQEPSWNWDYGLDQQAQRGMYQKIVIAEKQDYSYGHISPHGFGMTNGGGMDDVGGASHLYQKYYWRYLTARYSYSRAVHSWEYVNEAAPGDLEFPNEMGKYFHSIDPQRHLTSTSFWCCIYAGGEYFWANPSKNTHMDYADVHSYVNAGGDNTTWIGNTDPITGASTWQDSAIYTTAHSIDVYTKNAAGNKPIIMGEAGFGTATGAGATIAGNNDNETEGIWLKNFTWAQMNHGGMYFIYWYDQRIISNNLYPHFANFRKFMEGQPGDSINKRIPLNNGNYQSINLTVPSGVRGWGQKDVINGGAHFWIYDTAYTWQNPSGGVALGGKGISFSGLPAGSYTIEWWNTGTKTVTSSIHTSQNINHPGGSINLTVPAGFTGKDIAAKILPSSSGYPLPVYNAVTNPPVPLATPTPYPTLPASGPTSTPVPPTSTPTLTKTPTSTPAISNTKQYGDFNGDKKVDLTDLSILAQNWMQSTTIGDANGDGKVDLSDLSILAQNWMKSF